MNIAKNKIIIDGLVLINPMTGITRYVTEILKELDKIVTPNEVVLVIPSDVKMKIILNNIKTVVGPVYNQKMHLPYKLFIRKYVMKNGKLYINLSSSYLFGLHGYVCLHDIRPLCFNDNLFWGKPLIFKLRFLLMCLLVKFDAPIIVTDSEESKRLIVNILHIKPGRIKVIYCGWQHFIDVSEDSSIIKKFPKISEGPFYFTLGSMAPHKNFKWILETAKNNLDCLFVVAGGIEKGICGNKSESDFIAKNILYLGRITDGEIKFLMRKCKAFLFPSLFEGFGIPPLEALSVGAKIIVSENSCLPEIYGKYAYYINPYDYSVKLDKLLATHIDNGKSILKVYSWEKAAKQWEILIKSSHN